VEKLGLLSALARPSTSLSCGDLVFSCPPGDRDRLPSARAFLTLAALGPAIGHGCRASGRACRRWLGSRWRCLPDQSLGTSSFSMQVSAEVPGSQRQPAPLTLCIGAGEPPVEGAFAATVMAQVAPSAGSAPAITRPDWLGTLVWMVLMGIGGCLVIAELVQQLALLLSQGAWSPSAPTPATDPSPWGAGDGTSRWAPESPGPDPRSKSPGLQPRPCPRIPSPWRPGLMAAQIPGLC
jgi:hypothetical protein